MKLIVDLNGEVKGIATGDGTNDLWWAYNPFTDESTEYSTLHGFNRLVEFDPETMEIEMRLLEE